LSSFFKEFCLHYFAGQGQAGKRECFSRQELKTVGLICALRRCLVVNGNTRTKAPILKEKFKVNRC